MPTKRSPEPKCNKTKGRRYLPAPSLSIQTIMSAVTASLPEKMNVFLVFTKDLDYKVNPNEKFE